MPISVAARSELSAVAAPVRALLGQVLAQEGRRASEIGVTLADDATLRALNQRWRGIDRATDVLSFNYAEGEPGWETAPIRGDLAISMDRARAQAKRYRTGLGRELARLVVHGALHLCGHDHRHAAGRRDMRARERKALRAAARAVAALEAKSARAFAALDANLKRAVAAPGAKLEHAATRARVRPR